MKNVPDGTKRQGLRRARRVHVSKPVDGTDRQNTGSVTHRQWNQDVGFRVEALHEPRPHIGNQLCERLDRGPICERVREAVEMKWMIVDAHARERRHIGSCSRAHLKAAVAQCEQERDAKSMVYSSDAKQVWSQNEGPPGGRLGMIGDRNLRPNGRCRNRLRNAATIFLPPVEEIAERHPPEIIDQCNEPRFTTTKIDPVTESANGIESLDVRLPGIDFPRVDI